MVEANRSRESIRNATRRDHLMPVRYEGNEFTGSGRAWSWLICIAVSLLMWAAIVEFVR